jgi:lysophospholipase L1-like esterase
MKDSIIFGSLFSRRFILAAALSVVAAGGMNCPLHAQDAQSGPTPFPDPHNEAAWPGTGPIRVFPWMVDNRNYFWTLRDQKQGAVVFVGDSLIGNWGLAKVKTEQAFPKLKLVANRGIGGDVSRGVLFRLQEDVLDLHPAAVVILLGTNDLSAKAPIDGIVSNITAILDKAQKEYPNMPVVLCKLPPRNSPAAPIDPTQVTTLNDRLTQLAQGRQNVTLFDTYTLFAASDGTPDPVNYKKDLMHPSDVGYAKLGEALGSVFDQLKLQ